MCYSLYVYDFAASLLDAMISPNINMLSQMEEGVSSVAAKTHLYA